MTILVDVSFTSKNLLAGNRSAVFERDYGTAELCCNHSPGFHVSENSGSQHSVEWRESSKLQLVISYELNSRYN